MYNKSEKGGKWSWMTSAFWHIAIGCVYNHFNRSRNFLKWNELQRLCWKARECEGRSRAGFPVLLRYSPGPRTETHLRVARWRWFQCFLADIASEGASASGQDSSSYDQSLTEFVFSVAQGGIPTMGFVLVLIISPLLAILEKATEREVANGNGREAFCVTVPPGIWLIKTHLKAKERETLSIHTDLSVSAAGL